MDAGGVDFALVSNPIPGEFFATADQAARFNRRANEAVAELVEAHPDRFGLLAALPTPRCPKWSTPATRCTPTGWCWCRTPAASRVELLGNAFFGLDRHRITDALRRFHYDLALTAPSGLPSLLGTVPPERILFGTDWCAAPAAVVAAGVAALAAPRPELTDEHRQMINSGNALRLFPAVARRLGPRQPRVR